jgi:hypothetical protein
VNGLMWLLRAKRWAERPPSQKRVVLVLIVIAICALLYGIDRIFGWPDWLTVNRPHRGRLG